MKNRLLTERLVASIKPTDKRFEQWDTELPAFGVRVSPTGRKSYVLMYRHKERLRRLTLGTNKIMSLQSARTLAEHCLHANHSGNFDLAELKADARKWRKFTLGIL